jgi:hypothetical protein
MQNVAKCFAGELGFVNMHIKNVSLQHTRLGFVNRQFEKSVGFAGGLRARVCKYANKKCEFATHKARICKSAIRKNAKSLEPELLLQIQNSISISSPPRSTCIFKNSHHNTPIQSTTRVYKFTKNTQTTTLFFLEEKI